MEKTKNCWVIPTDKPSRLYLSNYGKELNLGGYPLRNYTTGQNIYITSDEEIKEGDWMIRNNEQPTKVTKDFFWDFGVKYYKIILTTDQDLIKDGVQAIDDEFIEWFVENPSCEEVDLDTFSMRDKVLYNVVYPKEEPKQDLEKEMFELEQQLDIPSSMRWYNSKPKQETLEEAIEQYAEIYRCPATNENEYCRHDIISAINFGAKWQQERSYSEEEVKNAFLDGWQLRDGDLPFPKAKKKWFNEFKNK